MVALLHPEHLAPEHFSIEQSPAEQGLAEQGPAEQSPAERPQLRLVEGGERQASAEQARLGPATATIVMIGLVVLMLIVVLRVAQGTPPAASWEGLSEAAYGSSVGGAEIQPAAAADLVYVVESGDTLWAIALELQPEADPRPVVDALADRNGGPALQVGQRLVVPANLLLD